MKIISLKIKKQHGINIDFKCYIGNVHDNIIRAAHLVNADLIVMGTHGVSGIKEWLFGSNAFSIVSNSTIPVLTINQNSNINSFEKIIFPFNENFLSLKQTEHVISIAKLFKSKVLLFGFSESNMPAPLTDLTKKANVLRNEFAIQGIQCSFSISNGQDYAEEILKYANLCNADMISVITNRSNHFDEILKSKPDKKLVNHFHVPALSIPVE